MSACCHCYVRSIVDDNLPFFHSYQHSARDETQLNNHHQLSLFRVETITTELGQCRAGPGPNSVPQLWAPRRPCSTTPLLWRLCFRRTDALGLHTCSKHSTLFGLQYSCTGSFPLHTMRPLSLRLSDFQGIMTISILRCSTRLAPQRYFSQTSSGSLLGAASLYIRVLSCRQNGVVPAPSNTVRGSDHSFRGASAVLIKGSLCIS